MPYLPKAVLGAVIVSAAIGLVDPAAWRGAARGRAGSRSAIAAMTTVGVVVSACSRRSWSPSALSIVDVVRRSARPHDAVLGWVDRLGRYADVEPTRRRASTPGVVVYRLDDRLFFANARYVKGRVREAMRGAPDAARWLVFDAEATPTSTRPGSRRSPNSRRAGPGWRGARRGANEGRARGCIDGAGRRAGIG